MSVSMRWKKIHEELPTDQQEVLIRERSIVQLAVFIKESSSFQLKNGSRIPGSPGSIQWLELAQ